MEVVRVGEVMDKGLKLHVVTYVAALSTTNEKVMQ